MTAPSVVSISYAASASAGVFSASFIYQTPIGTDFEVVDAEPANSGGVAAGTLSQYAPAGPYFLVSASVTDSAGNRTTYARDGSVSVSPDGLALPTGVSPDLSAGDFNLTNPGQDITSPELVAVGGTRPPAAAPGAAVTLSYAVSETNSGVAAAQLTYTSDLGQTFVVNDPAPSGDGVLHTVAAALPVGLRPGRFRLTDVLLSDRAGNQSEILSDGSILRTPEGLDGPPRTSANLAAATFRVLGGELVPAPGIWQQVHHGGVTFTRAPKGSRVAALVSLRCVARCGSVKVAGQLLTLSQGLPQTAFTTLSRRHLAVSGRGLVQAQLGGWVQPVGHDATRSGALQAVKPRALPAVAHGSYFAGVTSRAAVLSIVTSCVGKASPRCASSVRVEVVAVSHRRVLVSPAPAGSKLVVTLVGVVAGFDKPLELPAVSRPIGSVLLTSKVGGSLEAGLSGTALLRITTTSRTAGHLTLASSSTTAVLGRQRFPVAAGTQTFVALVRLVADGSCALKWSGPTPASASVTLVALTGA